MRIEKHLLLLLAVCCIQVASNAQELKHCGSTNAEKNLKEKYPELVSKINHFDDYLNAFDVSKLEKTRGNTLIIPVVFHIIHNYGVENISDAQIFDEMRILNEDYQKKNPDTAAVIPIFKPIIANCNYEFRLATKDPDGNCTNGIDRIASYKTYNADDQSKLNVWNPSYYLNIWVVNTIGANGVAGYAYKPATANVIFYYDGVLILHDYIGSTGTGNPNQSRALTHEIGHCMNLDHTWGPTNDPNIACGDDNVLDTPPTKGHTFCDLNDAFCNPLLIENVSNYMEYAYCSNMFTNGQKLRMDVTLANNIAMRSSLVSTLGHYWTGIDNPIPDCPPKADFTVNRQFTCIGNNLTFRNQSYNDTISSVNWTFPADATPTTSTSMTTTLANFSTIGWKNISLTATSSNTGSNSITKPNYIYAADPVGKNITGQTNSFEDQAENDKWPIFNYSNNYFKWKFYDQGSVVSGTKCLQYKAYDDRVFPEKLTLSPRGDIDDIITPAYNLSGLNAGNAFMNFYLAAATRGSTIADMTDTLFVYYSNNCGNTWTKLNSYQNASLFNNGSHTYEFLPNSTTDWRPISIALPSGALTNSTFVKFRFAPCDQSNNLYIENFQISSAPTNINESIKTGFVFDILPNPAVNSAAIQIVSSMNALADITITNIVGAKIVSMKHNVKEGIQDMIEIPANLFTSKGIYLITINLNNQKMTKKIVIE